MDFQRNDLHCHSTLSLCCADRRMTPEAILKHAVDCGYSTLCLTDHLWDSAVPGASDWYAGQDIEHLRRACLLPQSEKLHFHFGCETELPVNGIPALTREHFDIFDFVVIPVNHMHMEGLTRREGIDTPAKMARYIEDRLENLLTQNLPFRKIGIAHLTTHLMFKEGSVADVIACMSENRLLRIMKGYAHAGAGIELNGGCFRELSTRREDTLKIYRIAKEAGCSFYCSSDAHDIETMDNVNTVLPEIIDALGLTSEQQYVIP